MAADVIPPVPIIPPPVPPAPPVPTDWQKQLPFYLKIVGLAVVGLGGWIQNTLAPDADFQAVFPNAHNAIGIIVAVLGGIGTLCTTLLSNATNKKFQEVIDHKEAVIEHKDAVIVNKGVEVETAAAQIDVAAAAPAVIPPGKNPVKYRLKLALAEAVDADDDDMVDGIRLLLRKKAGAA